MKFLTRFFIGWSQIIKTIYVKNKLFKKNFLSYLITLFFGFIFGNLFGTLLSYIREFHIWDGFLIIILLLLFEIVNWVVYKKNKIKKKKAIQLHNLLNAFKTGLLLGFFVDAFKVGS